MLCPACGRELPSAFPGATVTCACGRAVEVPRAHPTPAREGPGASAGGPYRAAAFAPDPSTPVPCPYCGNDVPPLVRVCPHCDVRLDNVRCARCFSLQPPGAFSCGRCGQALELEPLLDATDAPCPRCSLPLEVAGGDARMHECPRCGGMFVATETLAEILCRAEVGGPLPDAVLSATPRRALEEVRYLPCPLCHTSMNRVNFGKVSGVIVDVCKTHGTWFDGGELTRVVTFAGAGGLGKTRAREEAAKKELAAKAHADLTALEGGDSLEDHLVGWREFLRTTLFR